MTVDGDATSAGLSPAQQRVVVELMAWGQERPTFDPDLGPALRAQLEEALAPVAAAVDDDAPGDELYVSKAALSQVHACEAHFRAQAAEPFEWNSRNARGSVVHKALELAVSSRHSHAPLDLIDHATEMLAGDDRRSSPGSWLTSAPELELAELRASANEMVVKFLECWPPLKAAWSPRSETKISAELCGGRIVLGGNVDLALGLARGREARALYVDLKTGRSYSNHIDDLRFYALIQTLRVGVPPFRVASYYLDTATFHFEDVTVETLEAALRRTIDGVLKISRLGDDSSPAAISPGATCGWCALRDRCEGPRLHAQARAAFDGEI